jgi:hypothetical protein
MNELAFRRAEPRKVVIEGDVVAVATAISSNLARKFGEPIDGG